jgi:NAD(P)-dependent dehydrogenase (short-subunit alcohol dehydrogenase family)
MAMLEGRVALVTGAASGIGRSSALTFAKHGARVVVADVVDEQGRETVDRIESAGGEAVYVSADVSRRADMEGLIRTVVETYGRLDCAHNNAGIERRRARRCAIPHVSRSNVGSGDWDQPQRRLVVHAGRVGADVGRRRRDYCQHRFGPRTRWRGRRSHVASKHRVVGLTKAAALEYATRGIRINAVCPGAIDTPMMRRISGRSPTFERQVLASEPIGRLGQPEEIAEAVVWLSSDAASFLTGVALPVDGGWVAR